VLKAIKNILYGLGLAAVGLVTYLLTRGGEAQELTQILTELNSGLIKVESGLTEISSGQKTLEKELSGVKNKAKELEAESIQQKKELAKLEGQLQNWRDLYDEMEAENKRLKWLAGGASAMAITALVIAVF